MGEQATSHFQSLRHGHELLALADRLLSQCLHSSH